MTVREPPTPQELLERIAAERAGLPFVTHRGADGAQRVVTLRDEHERLTIGRGDSCDIRLELDPEVSRVHAELQRVGEAWVVTDDGLSRNGTFVNDERVIGRRRLTDGEVIRCGTTLLTFRDPFGAHVASTRPADGRAAPKLTETQRRVLLALCRPLAGTQPYALPASNTAIAAELFLSVGAVKGHLRALFEKLEVEDLPHNHKRLRLAERALERGLVSAQELRSL